MKTAYGVNIDAKNYEGIALKGFAVRNFTAENFRPDYGTSRLLFVMPKPNLCADAFAHDASLAVQRVGVYDWALENNCKVKDKTTNEILSNEEIHKFRNATIKALLGNSRVSKILIPCRNFHHAARVFESVDKMYTMICARQGVFSSYSIEKFNLVRDDDGALYFRTSQGTRPATAVLFDKKKKRSSEVSESALNTLAFAVNYGVSSHYFDQDKKTPFSTWCFAKYGRLPLYSMMGFEGSGIRLSELMRVDDQLSFWKSDCLDTAPQLYFPEHTLSPSCHTYNVHVSKDGREVYNGDLTYETAYRYVVAPLYQYACNKMGATLVDKKYENFIKIMDAVRPEMMAQDDFVNKYVPAV